MHEHPERYVPETMAGLIKAEHETRYRWAASAVEGADVLDAACGVGYGIQVLADAGAARVVGIDRSAEAIENARARLRARAELVVGDLHALPFADASFDVVVCFEAIEHVERHDVVLGELKRALRPAGILLLSTPNPALYPPDNPHHVHELSPDELREALGAHFNRVDLYRQHPWVASLIAADEGVELEDPDVELAASVRKLAAVSPDETLYTLAVAGDGVLPRLAPLAMLGEWPELETWRQHAAALEAAGAALARDKAALEHELALVRRSLSWRLTAPLRSAGARLRGRR